MLLSYISNLSQFLFFVLLEKLNIIKDVVTCDQKHKSGHRLMFLSRELFRKYPLSEAAARSKPRSSKASSSRKDKGPVSSSAHYKPAFYTSPRSSPSTTVASDLASVSSSMTQSSTWSPFHLSSSPDLPDPTQAFMASRAEPSAKTYESPGENSTGPTPIVEEPPDASLTQPNQVPKSRPTNGLWFQLDDSSPDSWRKKISEMSA
ncbi:hypothetical protein Dsin_018884 [Dipteronia sinensis]|uniref:Uncharacterized protein n=1 Tax=Dipteronia sinensis TaxID=43782 RepID=A0AAE0E2B6_9ROSI|nr:hypothetical protein Dsin_018884 [Dipteronia sinensis]